MHKRDEPGAALKNPDSALQQRMGEADVRSLIGLQQVAIVAGRRLQSEADMEHQLKAGDLGLDARILQDCADAIAQAHAAL